MSENVPLPVRLQDLSKKFDSNLVVEQLNLDIHAGELLVLLGPSGSGKTTTLRMIAGLEHQNSGHIYIGSECVDSLAPKDRNIAMVFQDYALYPHMSVFDNIAFPLRIRTNLSDKEIRSRVEMTADLLGLRDLLNRKPSQASGGEQQRVALARAIVRDSRLFLMDEPLANLDAKLRVDMRAELQILQRRLGATMVCVSHDQSDAMTLGTRIAIMDKGHLKQVGTPAEVYREPADLFVAGFLGTPTMNFLEGYLNCTKGEQFIHFTDLDVSCLTATINQGCAELAERPVVTGIRPEKVRIAETDVKFAINGKVYVLQQMGSDTFAYIKLSNNKSIVLRTTPDTPLAVDDIIPVCWASEDVLVFDQKTGRRIK